MSKKRLRVLVPAVLAGCLAGGVASGLAASHGHEAAPQKTYRVSATLKGTGAATGLFSGNLTARGTTGTLAWKLTLRPSGTASSAQIRVGLTGAGKVLARLCAPCSVSAHGTKAVSGTALTTIVNGHVAVVVLTKSSGTLRGRAKATLVVAGNIVVPVTPALVAKGKALVANFSCEGCHTINGQQSTGPTWKGLAGSKVHLTDGTTIIATDSYLIGAITDPSTLKVEGYDSGVMSEVIAPGAISNAQAEAIVAYIKTIK
jgi:cytochrome c2